MFWKNYTKEKIEYLKYCHSNIYKLRASIYQRASILMAVAAFIFAGFSSFILKIFKSGSPVVESRIVLVLSILFLVSFLYTAFWNIMCLFPLPGKSLIQFLNRNKSIDDGKKTRTFTTFDYICDLRKNKFTKKVNKLNNEKILGQLITSTHNVSRISSQRYKYLHKVCIGLSFNIFIFVTIILIYIISKII